MAEEIITCSSSFPDVNLKRKKHDIKDGSAEPALDRLSDLPEALLVQIISLLEMKDAVKTGVLSKRWKNLWTFTDSIIIYHLPDDSGKETPNFFSFVDNILVNCNCPNIKQFYLGYFYDGPGKEIILKWIECVSKKNVEFLHLNVLDVGEIPECFYNNSSFVKLEIDSLTMGMSRSHLVSWSSLKSLCLSDVSTDNEQIAQILLGSPMLETLTLTRIWCVTQLDIISPSLKTLKLIEFEAEDLYDPLEINAPWIQQLEISGPFFSFFCRLVDVSSLSNADLSFKHLDNFNYDGTEDDEWLNVVTDFLQSMQNVEELTLGPVLIQAISILKLLEQPSLFFNCKHLTVCLSVMKYDLPGMASILQSSPHLETLSIKVLNDNEYYFSSYFDEIFDANLDEFLNLQGSNLEQLKKVTVIYDKDYCTKFEKTWLYQEERFVYELMEYLLQNSHIEKLVITYEENPCCICSGNSGFCAFKDAYTLSRKALYLSYDNGSSEWKFKKSESAYEFLYL